MKKHLTTREVLLLFKHKVTETTLDFSGIRTWFVRVEGECADHHHGPYSAIVYKQDPRWITLGISLSFFFHLWLL